MWVYKIASLSFVIKVCKLYTLYIQKICIDIDLANIPYLDHLVGSQVSNFLGPLLVRISLNATFSRSQNAY